MSFQKRDALWMYSTDIGHCLHEDASRVLVPVTIAWIALNAPWISQVDLSKSPPELNYLYVTTVNNTTMFLYHVRDAIAEPPPYLGIQVHRPQWASIAHIEELTKEDGHAECILSNETIVPVGRAKHSEV